VRLLKVAGIVATILWAVFIAWRVEETYELARATCGYAYSALFQANPDRMIFCPADRLQL